MLNKLSKGIVEWQIQRKYLSNEERELYEYAYEVLINQIINIIKYNINILNRRICRCMFFSKYS